MCVISMRGLSSLDAWCGALLVFSQISLALHDVFTNHFVAWRPFHSHFEVWKSCRSHFEAWRPFLQQMEDLAEGSYGVAKSFHSQRGVSQPILKPGAFS